MELQDEEPDAPEINYDEIAEWPVWSGYLQRAWQALRDDRFYGAMGGMGDIYYTAKSQYAADNDIPLEPFLTFMQALDGVYMTYATEKAKIEADKSPEHN